MIHTVKGFGIVNKAEIDVFLELSCFFNDPTWKILSITLLVCEMSTIVLISHVSKVMLKILQAGLQQYVNWKCPDVQSELRKGRGTRDQIATISWIIEKRREFQKKTIYFTDYTKALWLCGS